jgi:hypothetical protein
MIMPKDMQSAVHHQSQYLFTNGDALPHRVVASDFRTNVNVSDHGTTFSASPKAERDHVGRTVVAEVAAIELRHRRPPYERD